LSSAIPEPPLQMRTLHGKEGVDGSSPSEGSAKTLHLGAFWRLSVQVDLQIQPRAVGMELFMELSRSELRRAEARLADQRS